jgi:S1-C subfamily serine protease
MRISIVPSFSLLTRLMTACSALAACFIFSIAPAADPKTPLSGKDIYQKVLKSAVWIAHAAQSSDGRVGIASGSGSLIDVTGRYVLTNYHVVADSPTVAVFFPQYDSNRKLIPQREHYTKQLLSKGGIVGKVIYFEKKKDLAIVQLPSPLPSGVTSLPLAREGVGPGDSVHSIGNPGASGALWAYSPGSVKAVYPKKWDVMDRDGPMHFEATVVETTSPVNPGDSGGPLVNNFGELVAVTQGGISSMGTISYFIDLSEVRKVLKDKNIRITSPPASAVAATEGEAKVEDPGAAERQVLEGQAQAKLNAAELFRDTPGRYREKLEEVIKRYPDTKAAAEAKNKLAKLK